MVAVDLVCLQVFRYPEAVPVEREKDVLAKGVGERSVVEEAERPDPADRPQGHVHRARPVDAEADGVLPDPGADFRFELRRQPRVALDYPRAAERRQVLAPRQLPRNLDVAVFVELRAVDRLRRHEVPFPARFEISVPIDLRPEWRRPRPQEIELVREEAFDPAQQDLPLSGEGPAIESAEHLALGRARPECLERPPAPQPGERRNTAPSRHLLRGERLESAPEPAGTNSSADLVESPARQVARGLPGGAPQQFERLQATRAWRRPSTQRSNQATAL